jgi:hypothetical protein
VDSLSESTSVIRFSELKTEILGDVIILVSEDLDLMQVAEACALDDSSSFQVWMEKKQIRKPDADELGLLKKADDFYTCCIVKPFVFLKKVLIN